MKQYIYQVKGFWDETRKEALDNALSSLPMVAKATVEQKNEEGLILTLQGKAQLSARALEDLEILLSETLSKEGLTLETPALAQTYVASPPPKQGRTVPFMAALGAMITAVILSVLCTFAVMTATADQKANATVTPGTGIQEETPYDVLPWLDKLFAQASPYETDEAVLMEAVLDAYVQATGDRYAEYYNPEEFAQLTTEQNGEMCGIGIQILEDMALVDGKNVPVIHIVYVYEDSPAEAAGLLPGDFIVGVGKGEDLQRVEDIGYTVAVNLLAGEEGTLCEFSLYRTSTSETLEFSIKRQKMTVMSVLHSVCATDPTVGIIRMIQFNNTTASQLTAAVDALTAQGCTAFVLDLRGNPGGLLTSVIDVLTFFLDEGDVIMTSKDKYDRTETYKVKSPNDKGHVNNGPTVITAEEIGKYKDLNFVVLVNEYSASAAELFTANIRDYELGKIIGTKTYGKGSMQSTFSLSYYGFEGGIKMTTQFYFPPCGEGYDGIGITPHRVVELPEEYKNTNIYLLPHDKDLQLQTAIAELKP